MNLDDLHAVRRTFDLVRRERDVAADLLDRRLRALDASTDRSLGGRDVCDLVARFVDDLAVPGAFAATLRRTDRGRLTAFAHARQPLLVREAFLWTLRQLLGEAFTPSVRGAWTRAYALLSLEVASAFSEGRRNVGLR